MQCPSCGYQNHPDVRFCISCGALASQGNQPLNMQPTQGLAGPQTGQGWQQPPVILPASSTPMQEQSMRSVPPIQSGRGRGVSTSGKVFFVIVGLLVAIICAVVAYGFVSHQGPFDSSPHPSPIIVPHTVVPPTSVPPTAAPPTVVPPTSIPPITIPPLPRPPFVHSTNASSDGMFSTSYVTLVQDGYNG